MKKMLALLLSLALLAMPFCSFAEGLNLEGISDETGLIDKTATSDKASLKGLFSSDTVDDVDGKLVVTTSFGLTITADVPDGMLALTQSYFHDIAIFNAYYSDPQVVIQKWVDGGMHLNLFTSSGNCIDTFFYAFENTNALGEMIGDVNQLSDSDAKQVAAYLAALNETDFTYGMIGSQVWFVANLIEENNMIFAITYVNGRAIQAYVQNVATSADVDTAMKMIGAVSFSSK